MTSMEMLAVIMCTTNKNNDQYGDVVCDNTTNKKNNDQYGDVGTDNVY